MANYSSNPDAHQSPHSPVHNKRKLILVFIVFVFFLSSGIVYAWKANFSLPTDLSHIVTASISPSASPLMPQPSPSVMPPTQSPYANAVWKTFKDTLTGFSFQYPPDYDLPEYFPVAEYFILLSNPVVAIDKQDAPPNIYISLEVSNDSNLSQCFNIVENLSRYHLNSVNTAEQIPFGPTYARKWSMDYSGSGTHLYITIYRSIIDNICWEIRAVSYANTQNAVSNAEVESIIDASQKEAMLYFDTIPLTVHMTDPNVGQGIIVRGMEVGCGVPTNSPCPTTPVMWGTPIIIEAVDSIDSNETPIAHVVGTFKTDPDGVYRVSLDPGRYVVYLSGFPYSGILTVNPGQFTEADFNFLRP